MDAGRLGMSEMKGFVLIDSNQILFFLHFVMFWCQLEIKTNNTIYFIIPIQEKIMVTLKEPALVAYTLLSFTFIGVGKL